MCVCVCVCVCVYVCVYLSECVCMCVHVCALLKVGSKFNAACVKTAHTAMSYCCTENVNLHVLVTLA